MSWAHYLLQVNIYLVVFYGFYKLLLDKETYFTFNRIYLVSAGLLSLAIPYLRFEWFTKQTAMQPVYISVEQLMGQVSIVEEAPDGFNAGNLIVLAYLIGISFFSVRFILGLLSVNRKLKQEENGAAFSFFWKKRIDINLPQLKTVHKHEDAHVRQWHSIDVLFFEILSVFTWFNPIIYLYKDAVKCIHEYLADEEAAEFQGDKEQYALLLLSSAFGVPVNALTNSFFNRSLIKKRIFMLHKKRSPKMAVLKYGLVIPLFAIALIMSSATIRNNEQIQKIADNIPLNTPVEVVTEVVKESIRPVALHPLKKIEVIPEEGVKALAGWEYFYRFMKRSLRFPALAQENKIQGTAMLKFTITGGQLENISVATKLGGGCDAEAMRSLASFPDYKSIKDGKYTIKISFHLDGVNTPLQNEKIASINGYTALDKITIVGYGGPAIARPGLEDDTEVHDFVSLEIQPAFRGGMAKFYDYLAKNIRYPKEAVDNKVEGKVFLSFVVEKDGTLTDVRVRRSLGSGTDEEAIRILEESPKWTPGLIGGKPVRVLYNIPISFKLNNTEATTLKNSEKTTALATSITGAEILSNNTNPPLVIIDGIKANVLFPEIKPENIASISVFKGEKAIAEYGLDGINGVIVIVTKPEKAKPKVIEIKLGGPRKDN